MIERLNDNDGVHAIIDKINEIVDFLNGTYLVDVTDGNYVSCGPDVVSSYDCVEKCPPDTIPSVFVTGLSVIDDNVSHDDIDTIRSRTAIASDVKCPHCGVSYYTIKGSESTCVYFAPVMKDGVNINPDRNIHTTHCECLNCHKEFDI